MQGRSAESTCRILAFALLPAATAALFAEPVSIVKPPSGAWILGDEVQIIARAPEGRILLDGMPVEAHEPFPGVLHSSVTVSEGKHRVTIESPDGSATAEFHTGRTPDAGTRPYADHPPVATACTHCHSLSRRGRFRFSGGCEVCHAREPFIQQHSHEPHELASCGMCHDGHGSSTASLLLMSKDLACKQCHN